MQIPDLSRCEIYLLTVNPASDVLMPACQDMLNQHAQQPKICTLFQESFKIADMDQDQTEKMKTSGTLAFGERKFRSRILGYPSTFALSFL